MHISRIYASYLIIITKYFLQNSGKHRLSIYNLCMRSTCMSESKQLLFSYQLEFLFILLSLCYNFSLVLSIHIFSLCFFVRGWILISFNLYWIIQMLLLTSSQGHRACQLSIGLPFCTLFKIALQPSDVRIRMPHNKFDQNPFRCSHLNNISTKGQAANSKKFQNTSTETKSQWAKMMGTMSSVDIINKLMPAETGCVPSFHLLK